MAVASKSYSSFTCFSSSTFSFFIVKIFNIKSTLNKLLSTKNSIINSRFYAVHCIYRTYLFCLVKILYIFANISIFLFSLSGQPPFYLSASVNLTILHNWYYVIFVTLSLSHFCVSSWLVHVVINCRISFQGSVIFHCIYQHNFLSVQPLMDV